MTLISIQVGKPKNVQWLGKPVLTGIFKDPVAGAVWVRKLNLEGDAQADLSVHGGEDKAVYAYSQDAYPWWYKALNLEHLPPGAFGENLTIEVLNEATIYIGDRYRLGEAELQVVQPRFPCHKLGIKFGDMKILKTFMEGSRPGIYFRVLKEGKIQTGDTLTLLEQDIRKFSVRDFFEAKKNKFSDKQLLKKALQIPSLNSEWRKIFSDHL